MSCGFSFTKLSSLSLSSSTSGTLLSPAEDSDYTVFSYTEVLGTSPFGGGTVTISWTDNYGPTSKDFAMSAPGGTSAAPITVHAAGGTDVTYSVSWDNGGGSNTYNLFFSLLGY